MKTLLAIVLAISVSLNAASPTVVQAWTTADVEFPAGWTGVWSGPLRIASAGGKVTEIRMELHIARLEDAYQWKIVYDDGQRRQERDYRLLTVDASMGTFRIDERNSIILPAGYFDGALVSEFEVQGSRIVSSYRLVGDTLIFDLTMRGADSTDTTGGQGGVPPVTSFTIRNVQRAVLKRTTR